VSTELAPSEDCCEVNWPAALKVEIVDTVANDTASVAVERTGLPSASHAHDESTPSERLAAVNRPNASVADVKSPREVWASLEIAPIGSVTFGRFPSGSHTYLVVSPL